MKKPAHSRRSHPTEESLLAAYEGGLALKESAGVCEHVSGCALCQDRLRRLQAELQWFESVTFPPLPASALEPGLERLRERISAWNRAHPETEEPAREAPSELLAVYGWLAAELSIYLGAHTANALVRQARDRAAADPSTFNAMIEPVISEFFGQKTGSAVAAQVARLWNQAQQLSAQAGVTP